MMSWTLLDPDHILVTGRLRRPAGMLALCHAGDVRPTIERVCFGF